MQAILRRVPRRRRVWTVAAGLAALFPALAPGARAAHAQDYPPGPALCQNLSAPLPPAPARWAPVEEQLAHDRIQPGSALARLVRANQDLGLLDPREAGDGKPLPPWLRVQWRKAEPHSRYVPADPNGGYPTWLRSLYRWMLRHQDLKPGAAPPAAAAWHPAATTMAGNSENGQQRISGAQQAAVNGSTVRINVYNPSEVLAVADEAPSGDGRVQFYYSTDGGLTWGGDTLPLGPNDFFQTDGAVDWAADGTAWAVAAVVVQVNQFWAYYQLRAYRSADHGQTWTLDALLSGNQKAAREGTMAVDHSAASPYKESVYALWSTQDSVFFARRPSADGTWRSAIEISDSRTGVVQEGVDIQVDSAGNILAFWADEAHHIFVAKSVDGGVSFATPVLAASVLAFTAFPLPPAFDGVLTRVTGGTWHTATADDVYMAWPDLSGDPGCTLWTEEPTFFVPYNSCKGRIWFARSTDGGATWSAPVKVFDRPVVDDQFSSTLTVDPASGRISLTYYDTIGDPSRATTNLFYQSSSDGGTTWSAPFQVTTARSNETLQNYDPEQYGPRNGLSAFGGSIVATWTDRRSGGFEEVWAAVIADPATCGGPAVTGLAATAQPAGVNLTWDAVPGAPYRVLRARASGGPYGLIATTSLNVYFDPATTCGTTSYYTVQAVGSCVSSTAAEASAASRPAVVLYSNNFDSASGLAGWTTGAVPGLGSAADWRGVQTCPAHSGGNVFRFGGATCTSDAAGGDAVFAYPGGADGIAVPVGASNVQMSFWQRRAFDQGSGGMLALSASDLFNACVLLAPTALAGETYNAFTHTTCLSPELQFQPIFTGTDDTFTNTVVDLDRAWSDTFEIAGSTAGHVIEPIFLGITDCSAPQTGWFLDDVTVTACTAPPAPSFGFYTLPPCRLLDTRQAAGPGGGPPLAAGASRDLVLAGNCGIPPTARALSVNITVVQPPQAGSLLLYADDQPAPLASTISFGAGAVRANNAILALGNGTGGAIAQNQSAGSVQLLIDVNGYFQ